MRVADTIRTTEADVARAFSQGGAGYSHATKGGRLRIPAGKAFMTHSGSKHSKPIKLGVSPAELDDEAQRGAPRGKKAKKPY